jgi:PTS system mannose-specific IID component
MIGNSLLLAALIAGITALDNVHMLQWMISRPVIAGSLVGAALGDLNSGMLCGAMIELVWLGVLPIGNYTPPDAHITACAAATVAAAWGGGPGGCLVAVLLCVPIGVISKRVDLQMRHALGLRAEAILKGPPPYHSRALVVIALAPVIVKAALAVLLVGVAAGALEPIARPLWAHERLGRGLLVGATLVPALGMVQLARCIGARGREKWVAMGSVAAILFLIALRVIP